MKNLTKIRASYSELGWAPMSEPLDWDMEWEVIDGMVHYKLTNEHGGLIPAGYGMKENLLMLPEKQFHVLMNLFAIEDSELECANCGYETKISVHQCPKCGNPHMDVQDQTLQALHIQSDHCWE